MTGEFICKKSLRQCIYYTFVATYTLDTVYQFCQNNNNNNNFTLNGSVARNMMWKERERKKREEATADAEGEEEATDDAEGEEEEGGASESDW